MKKHGKFNALKAWQELVGLEDYDTFLYYPHNDSYRNPTPVKCFCLNGHIFEFSGISLDIQIVGFLINGLWDIYNVQKTEVIEMSILDIKKSLGLPCNARLNITDKTQ